VCFPGDDRVGQIGDGSLKFLVRDGVISRFQGGFASRKGGFAVRYASLTPLHFALGDVIGVLCKRAAAKDEEARRCNSYYVLGDFHKSHLFLLSLCIRAIRGIHGRCCAFCPGRLHIEVAFT
jgi:hypothetical protein